MNFSPDIFQHLFNEFSFNFHTLFLFEVMVAENETHTYGDLFINLFESED